MRELHTEVEDIPCPRIGCNGLWVFGATVDPRNHPWGSTGTLCTLTALATHTASTCRSVWA